MENSKKCCKCGEVKALTEFHKNSRAKDGLQYHCKTCDRAKSAKWRKNNPEKVRESDRKKRKRKKYQQGGYAVYYLPEHHYVGMTNNLPKRIREHESKNNRLTDNYEVIGIYETAIEAHLVETQLHFMGYFGFHYIG